MEPERLSRRRFLALGAGSLAAVAVGCTPGTSTRQASAPPAPAATGVTETGPVTLTVWDQESGKVSHIWDDLVKGFEAKYPNVTINRVERSFGDLKALLKLALTGPKAPDVVEANQGWPDMGEMVKAGLLLPLDNYATAYGWFDRVSANANALNTWTPDGRQFGTGSLFGFTNEGELVGVYYNKATMQKLGLTVPTTFAEFQTSLGTAKQAGEIPIQYADLDGFPGIHEWEALQERFVPQADITDFIFGREYDAISFDTPQNVQAATVLQDWVRNGYFTPDFLAVGYDDTVTRFGQGQGLYFITGNWIVGNLGPDSTDFGFFAMPPTTAGGVPVSTGGPGFPLAISSSTEHPDTAAAFIDWMTNADAAQTLLPAGQIPLNTGFTPTGVTPGTLLAEMLAAASKVNDTNALVPYEDWAAPGFYNTLTGAVQELMGLKVSPQQFVAKVESDYSTFQKSRSPAASATATAASPTS
ncbi:MAG: raffinose/stachyose/melibiose transport system substrate-binding protein [Actinomycetota bacterium]|nr:raffinose/stachyose/melibiose transport system substrate-binding protein [Actinomycetota bacterium]